MLTRDLSSCKLFQIPSETFLNSRIFSQKQKTIYVVLQKDLLLLLSEIKLCCNSLYLDILVCSDFIKTSECQRCPARKNSELILSIKTKCSLQYRQYHFSVIYNLPPLLVTVNDDNIRTIRFYILHRLHRQIPDFFTSSSTSL